MAKGITERCKMRFITLLIIVLSNSFIVSAQSQNCSDTAQAIKRIQKLFNETVNEQKEYTRFELFQIKSTNNYKLIPCNHGIYGHEAIYQDETIYIYVNDTLVALNNRTYVFKNDDSAIRLISVTYEDPAEGALYNHTDFYINNDELYFSYYCEISKNYWGKPFNQTRKELRLYYCDTSLIRCLRKEKTFPLEESIDFNKLTNEQINLSASSSNYSDFLAIMKLLKDS